MDHQAVFEQAWAAPGNTKVDLPPVRVNEVLRERYDVSPPFEYTGTQLWDMETRKAKQPDVYLPGVVTPGSAEKFPSTWHGQVEEFVRVSEQKLWLDRERSEIIIEQVRLDHARRRAFFVGAERFEAPDGRVFIAGKGQPIFHVEHSVAGTEEDPLNLWDVVNLTEQPDPELAAAFDPMAHDPYLRVFIEVHLREALGRALVRRQALAARRIRPATTSGCDANTACEAPSTVTVSAPARSAMNFTAARGMFLSAPAITK